ncbi:MAG: two-component system sensor histidine kinase PhoQ [Saprospiraceae bacterium]|jgi:two-component system sensor histidine kinase PhoQ
MYSLRRRILVATYGTIILFMLLAGIALDKAFQRVIRSNIHDQLESMTFALLATAELDQQGVFRIPQQLPQIDITIPGSGLIAMIVNDKKQIIWLSPSALGETLPEIQPLPPGAAQFKPQKGKPHQPFVFSFGSVWGNAYIEDQFLTFSFIQSKSSYLRQISGYRETLVQWLGGGALFIFLLHGLVVLRELRPLSRVVEEIDKIESGEIEEISEGYPNELAQLTERINRFIKNERAQLQHYRHGLDDLAHSLKTPLAVIRGIENEAHQDEDRQQLRQQVDRMTQIIDYQLKRASSAGKQTLGQNNIDVKPIVLSTGNSLLKVYADKAIQFDLSCDEKVFFRGDKDDLYEMVGNLTDNAFKWANKKVIISCNLVRTKGKANTLIIRFEDDGPGISEEIRKSIIKRGVRADEQTPGQGIGLSVINSILEAAEGSLTIGRSDLGGAKIQLELPAANT